MDYVGIRSFFQSCRPEIRFEGLQDLLRIVHEVENEGVFLSWENSVQPGEGLDRQDSCQSFVDILRMEKGLIEPRLELVGHDQNPVVVGVEGIPDILPPEIRVHVGFREFEGSAFRIGDFSGKSDQGHTIAVPMFRDVFVEGDFVPDGRFSGVGDDHRFGFSSDFGKNFFPEMLDDDRHLLGNVVGMKAEITSKGL